MVVFAHHSIVSLWMLKSDRKRYQMFGEPHLGKNMLKERSPKRYRSSALPNHLRARELKFQEERKRLFHIWKT